MANHEFSALQPTKEICSKVVQATQERERGPRKHPRGKTSITSNAASTADTGCSPHVARCRSGVALALARLYCNLDIHLVVVIVLKQIENQL